MGVKCCCSRKDPNNPNNIDNNYNSFDYEVDYHYPRDKRTSKLYNNSTYDNSYQGIIPNNSHQVYLNPNLSSYQQQDYNNLPFTQQPYEYQNQYNPLQQQGLGQIPGQVIGYPSSPSHSPINQFPNSPQKVGNNYPTQSEIITAKKSKLNSSNLLIDMSYHNLEPRIVNNVNIIVVEIFK